MSENIPESIPTSADPRSHRPVKKLRGPLTSATAQSLAVSHLFDKQPDIEIPISATRGPRTASSLAPPPEIVANVQGSSAGAGSGEFHVYKASRRREYERIRLMEEEAAREEANQKWEEKQKENKVKDETKLGKNQRRREKAKARKTKPATTAQDGPDEPMGGAEVKSGRSVAIPDAAEGVHEVVKENGIVIHED